MNWRVSSLDRFRLVSNSDAHSPEKLGREVCVFDTELDYFALRRALERATAMGGRWSSFPKRANIISTATAAAISASLRPRPAGTGVAVRCAASP